VSLRSRFRSPIALFAAVFAGSWLALPASITRAEEEQEDSPVVEDGRQVSIEYTLTVDDGTVADSNVGGEPLTYEQGAGQILPALEGELAGLAVGASKEVELAPEQGYGPVNPELYETVEAKIVPEEARSPGTQLLAQSAQGEQRPVRVHEVKGDEIVLDLNHPLAGKNLHFDIKIVGVE